jgi:hypothetical protein
MKIQVVVVVVVAALGLGVALHGCGGSSSGKHTFTLKASGSAQ